MGWGKLASTRSRQMPSAKAKGPRESIAQKIDVEGSEASVLAGVHRAIVTSRPVTPMELLGPVASDLIFAVEALRSSGYVITRVDEGKGHPDFKLLPAPAQVL